MANPLHSVISAAEHFVSPITNMFSRMFTIPNTGAPDINIPAPTQQIPAQQPATVRPQPRSMQQSFLSGAAASALPSQPATKTLLGS